MHDYADFKEEFQMLFRTARDSHWALPRVRQKSAAAYVPISTKKT
jgi:hypothetical protein